MSELESIRKALSEYSTYKPIFVPTTGFGSWSFNYARYIPRSLIETACYSFCDSHKNLNVRNILDELCPGELNHDMRSIIKSITLSQIYYFEDRENSGARCRFYCWYIDDETMSEFLRHYKSHKEKYIIDPNNTSLRPKYVQNDKFNMDINAVFDNAFTDRPGASKNKMGGIHDDSELINI